MKKAKLFDFFLSTENNNTNDFLFLWATHTQGQVPPLAPAPEQQLNYETLGSLQDITDDKDIFFFLGLKKDYK